jgi:hypothetical protein
VSVSSVAEDKVTANSSFSVAGGVFDMSGAYCNKCDFSGKFVKGTYALDDTFEFELKYAEGENDFSYANEMDITYLGVDFGHSFNIDWFKLFGKLGYSKANYDIGYGCSYTNCSVDSRSKSAIAYGIGARFYLPGVASSLYVDVEWQSIGIDYTDLNEPIFISLGYRF